MGWLENIGNDLPQEETIESLNVEETIDKETEWRINRLGKVTGSQFGKFVKLSKDKKNYVLSTGKVAEDLIYKIAWERLLKDGNISEGIGRLSINSQSMQHGNDFEGEAILKYIKITGNEVVYEQEFIPKGEWIGGTPDGFVGKDGIIEVKCPWNGGNHLKTLLTNEIYNTDYIYQIQGYLWITERKWCDFITYDPDLIDELQLSITRIERDESIIDGIKKVIEEVIEKIKEIINQIEKK